MTARATRMATCHPDRKQYGGKGLCAPCYGTAWLNAKQERRDRMNARRRARYAEDAEYRRAISSACLMQTKGIDLDTYDSMLKRQGGGCAICFTPPHPKRRLCVDHCHETGRIRGLLCARCNRGLGYFSDESGRLVLAALYLEGSR